MPVQDPEDDVFAGLRPLLLPNGTWPESVWDWELQGWGFNAVKDTEVATALAGGDPYMGLGKTAGVQLVSTRAPGCLVCVGGGSGDRWGGVGSGWKPCRGGVCDGGWRPSCSTLPVAAPHWLGCWCELLLT